MKIMLLFSIQLLLIGGCSKPVDESMLQERNGIKYLPNSEDPYSGQAFSLHKNGQKDSESHWKNGKLDGLFNYWYENGQKEFEGNYRNGNRDGSHNSWYSQ